MEKGIPLKIDISDEDIYEAMKDVAGYLDITPQDFKELYLLAYRHAVKRITGEIKAKDIMTEEVISATKETPLKQVAEIMAVNKISGLPVVTGDNKVVGVISEKDFLSHIGIKDVRTFMGVVSECLKGKGCVAVSIRGKKAGDIMTTPAITVGEQAALMEIAGIFTEKNINRVPVIDSRGCLTGIVSRADIVRASLIKNKQ